MKVGEWPFVPPASGIRWSQAHWSKPFSDPAATSPASAANAAASSADNGRLLARDTDAQCRRHDLEPRRRRPDRLAVDLDRQRLAGVDRQRSAAHVVDL